MNIDAKVGDVFIYNIDLHPSGKVIRPDHSSRLLPSTCYDPNTYISFASMLFIRSWIGSVHKVPYYMFPQNQCSGSEVFCVTFHQFLTTKCLPCVDITRILEDCVPIVLNDATW